MPLTYSALIYAISIFGHLSIYQTRPLNRPVAWFPGELDSAVDCFHVDLLS